MFSLLDITKQKDPFLSSFTKVISFFLLKIEKINNITVSSISLLFSMNLRIISPKFIPPLINVIIDLYL